MIERQVVIEEAEDEKDRVQTSLERLWSDGLPTSCSIADVLLLLEAQVGS